MSQQTRSSKEKELARKAKAQAKRARKEESGGRELTEFGHVEKRRRRFFSAP